MGAGVPSGLQNRFEELRPSQVGSIPTYSCQIQRKMCALQWAHFLLCRKYCMWYFRNINKSHILKPVVEPLLLFVEVFKAQGDHNG